MPSAKPNSKKFGPAGGCSLSARIPLMVGDMACRDSVTFITLYISNTFLGRRRFAKMDRLGYIIVLFGFLGPLKV